MQQATEELIKKMQDDKKFAEKIMTCKENDEVIAFANEEEIDLTLENIVEVNETFKFAQRMEDGELTEEELEQVAGGTMEVIATIALAATATVIVVSLVGASISLINSAIQGCIKEGDG